MYLILLTQFRWDNADIADRQRRRCCSQYLPKVQCCWRCACRVLVAFCCASIVLRRFARPAWNLAYTSFLFVQWSLLIITMGFVTFQSRRRQRSWLSGYRCCEGRSAFTWSLMVSWPCSIQTRWSAHLFALLGSKEGMRFEDDAKVSFTASSFAFSTRVLKQLWIRFQKYHVLLRGQDYGQKSCRACRPAVLDPMGFSRTCFKRSQSVFSNRLVWIGDNTHSLSPNL